MRIERWDDGDDAAVRNCLDVWQAAQRADDPIGPPKSAHVMRGWMKLGFQGHPGEVWLVPGDPRDPRDPGAESAIDAWYRLGLSERENLTTASVTILVRPTARRRGIATELLRHAAGRATANGRTLLSGEVRENSGGESFAERFKATRGLTEVRRVLDLDTLPPGQLRKLREEAAPKAVGYTLVSWIGVTPEEYLDKIAKTHEAMNDAPHDPGFEPRAWDGERVREMDARGAIYGMRVYSVAAVHDTTGDVAALTQAFVDPETPEWGHQGLTAVTSAHRGHRLGLLVKAEMMEWLAEAEPRVRKIDTGNAAANKHMIAVNEALGYRVYGPGWVSYELPVSELARASEGEP